MGVMIRDAELARYCGVIEGALRASLPGQVYGGNAVEDLRVERGVAYPLLMLPPDRRLQWTEREIRELLVRPTKEIAGNVRVLDTQGHQRPVYAGLLLYSAFQACRLSTEYWSRDEVEPWRELAEARFAAAGWPVSKPGVLDAADGAAVVESIWLALAIDAEGEPHEEPDERVSDAFEALVRCQQPSGTFLKAGARDNPETHWYHELLLLHAATSYAALRGDRALEAAVMQAAEFHQAETQPDHATNQPWGLAAFVRNPATRPLADGVLHAAATIGRGSGVTSILLADALYCLRLWMA
jgi:hypothetical protein